MEGLGTAQGPEGPEQSEVAGREGGLVTGLESSKTMEIQEDEGGPGEVLDSYWRLMRRFALMASWQTVVKRW